MRASRILLSMLALTLLVVGGCAQKKKGPSPLQNEGKYEYVPPWKEKKAEPAVAPAPVTPAVPISPRDEKLAELLRKYRQGEITAREYQEQRAKILSEK